MPHLHIIYASTSGHTEYVVQILMQKFAQEHELTVTKVQAERATEEDFATGNVLILASGTWNTGGREGQLNPHMHELLLKRCKDIDLAGKPCAIIGLGDERYHYTARATEHLKAFVESHGGTLLSNPLVIVNEPYGQEKMMEEWAQKFLRHLT